MCLTRQVLIKYPIVCSGGFNESPSRYIGALSQHMAESEKTMKKRVGIVGGGAAGMMAAITAAGQGAAVTIMEGNDRVGKKLLATGNGKCNLGNRNLTLKSYYTENPQRLQDCLKRFGTEETISFFGGLGLLIKEKNGYLYPACEQASAVLDVLRYELSALGIRIITGCKVNQILPGQKGGEITVKAGNQIFGFDSVVIACGGKAAPKTGSDGSGFQLAERIGHKLLPSVPALVQLKCSEPYLKAVSGVRAEAFIRVVQEGECIVCERGELQLTDYGISGIPVFQVSRQVNYILRKQKEVEITIDFLPDYKTEEYEAFQAGRKLLQRGRTVEEFFTGMLHKKLMLLFVKTAGLRPGDPAEAADAEKVKTVYRLCREWKLHVHGHNSYDNAQVCAGGVPLDQVTENLESRKAPGIFFAGEILDVDGKCGGYNLQWAWCSGYLAGKAAAGNFSRKL